MEMVSQARAKARANVAKALGVSDYSVLVNAGQHETAEIIARAKKARKSRPHSAPALFYTGSPYILLGRYMDKKGKAVKYK